MQFAHGFETVYPYFIEKYPELFHISRETFAGVFDDIDLHPSEITEDASIFLNYLFCFFVLFDNTYTTSKGKTCTGWEVLKTDKSIKIDPKAKSILNKINKAKWKVFRVKRRTMISWQGYLREVKLDKRLESFGPEYKISFDEFSPIARDND
ncbi:MAG: hypothetical protein JJT78_06385, partial [Leptospira sp.]|nr:hypothetical protein [Leptospira sp.]